MELTKKLIVIVSILLVFAVSVYAAVSHVYTNVNYHQNNLLNISNITYAGILTDGTLRIQGGNITYANFINVTTLLIAGASPPSITAIDNGTIIRNNNYTWLAPNNASLLAFIAANNATLSAFTAAANNSIIAYVVGNYVNNTQQVNNNASLLAFVAANNATITSYTSAINNSVLAFVAANNDTGKNWTLLENYPNACPANTYVTAINDTITCTSLTLNLTAINQNITQVGGKYHCFDTSCNSSIYYNGTSLVIKVN